MIEATETPDNLKEEETMNKKTVGFPMIHNFEGDKRDFIPELFRFMDRYEGVEFYLEEGYGSRLGYTPEDYLKASSKVHFVPFEEAYKQDITMILKDPDIENLELLRDGTVFFTMIHYPTHPTVVEVIKRKKLKSFSMDSIVDDDGLRLFVDYFGTSYCACATGVETLKKQYPDFYSEERGPIKVLVMGAGGVGQAAVRAMEIIGDKEFLASGQSGFATTVITRTITGNREALRALLAETDILVDATQRRNQTILIIANEDLACLPEHAVIVDISGDRDDFTENPPIRRAIEGTLKGSPSKMVIYPDDPGYDELPEGIVTTNRRTTVSCDAWPGVDTERSVQCYCKLMKNYVGILLTKEPEEISIDSDNMFERALSRSTLKYFEENRH